MTDLLENPFHKFMQEAEEKSEAFWNSLTEDQQIDVFCAVVRRIHQGELVDEGTYRHVLYGVFGFGPGSYAKAQMAGYLDVHNAIVSADHDSELLKAFCIKYQLPQKLAIDFLI